MEASGLRCDSEDGAIIAWHGDWIINEKKYNRLEAPNLPMQNLSN
jgi:hypothetical protein